ncbi:hypothetical protein QU481_06140 [Crenobacter sp. SG2303]|uniref:Uncharacterized protein n=1 Tax=Crenobacter oryzisoli TaxID=3056844 RepID=A0ABT7XL16_9NEIS|nr:hypothetical protein [Crenobacter sp. SG2303]MDN0074475.1 hypothetical protein [Crenobacter sp. SG2303]
MKTWRRLGSLALWLGLLALWLWLLTIMPKAQAMTGPGHCGSVRSADSRVAVATRDRAFEAGETTGSERGWRDCLPGPLERLRELGDTGVESNDGRIMVSGGPAATGHLLGLLVIWAGQESLLIGMLLDEPRRPRGTAPPPCRGCPSPVSAGAGIAAPSISLRA